MRLTNLAKVYTLALLRQGAGESISADYLRLGVEPSLLLFLALCLLTNSIAIAINPSRIPKKAPVNLHRGLRDSGLG